MAQLGRIGGHLLNENLVREGVDLAFKNTAFDTDPVLYLDVDNGRVGFKTDSPVYDLDVRTNVSTTNLGATDQMEIDQVYINADGFFTSGTGPINITPAGKNPLIVLERLISDNLQINDNKISSFENSNIVFDPNGTGTVEIQTDVNLLGNLQTSQDINIDGDLSTPQNIIIGDSPLDVVRIVPELEQGLTTGSDLTFNLGSPTKQWAEIYTPDMTNIANVQPQAARVSEQMLIDGVNNEINTLQSNDNLNLITGTKNFVVNEILNPNIFNTEQNDAFGHAVAVCEQYSIISALGEDDPAGTNSGVVYVYDNRNNRIVHQIENPNAERTPQDDLFGSSVAISNEYSIVGAPREDRVFTSPLFNEGKAYVFDNFSGILLHTLNQPATLTSNSNDNFGESVDINDDFCVVGAPRINEGATFNDGKVFLFQNSTGTLLHTFDNPDALAVNPGDRFGQTVAISQSKIAVGAPFEDEVGFNNSGKVYIFDIISKSLLLTLDNPNDSGTSDGDNFGSAIDLTDNFVVVGSHQEDSNSGRVYVFDADNGQLLYTLANPLGSTGSLFGFSVAVSGNRILVGAYQEDDSTESDNGKAFMFDTDTGNFLQEFENPNASGSGIDDYFGSAVDLYVNERSVNKFSYSIIGARLADNILSDSGKAYLYTIDKFPIEIEETTWQNSQIINNLNTPLIFDNTGIGYTRFMGDNGMQFPAGTNQQRPAQPEIGDTRWNTEEQLLECFDGSVYVVSIGAGDPVTTANMEDFGTLYSLFLG